MSASRLASLTALLVASLVPLPEPLSAQAPAGSQTPAGSVAPAGSPAPPAAPVVQGRIDTVDGLRVVHVWGDAQQRGYAHGFLLAADVTTLVREEFAARFARLPGLLQQARGAIGRVVTFPDEVRTELEAVYAGVVAAGVSRDMPELEREFDLTDLLVANALDVFALMGCSGFCVWGEQAVGGGVLTGRNFDWPFTGQHMLDGTILLVQHPSDGRVVASVTWPGYVGSVSAVSSDGVAAFLHVGTGKLTRTPEPESWPTAVAAQLLLRRFDPAAPAAGFDLAAELLGYTSPPAGFLTHVVLPRPPADAAPVGLFEVDARKCVRADLPAGLPSVVTNHFLTRTDGRGASLDSVDRQKRIRTGLEQCLLADDRLVSVDEGWTMLRGGGHAFGTLHSLVYRHEPWVFELRVADLGVPTRDAANARRPVVAAPDSRRSYRLRRDQVFPRDPAAAPR